MSKDMFTLKPLVYVAGPLTSNNGQGEFKNVHDAVTLCQKIWDLGAIPFVPHLSSFWFLIYPYQRTYEHWLDYDFNVIRRCNAMFRMPGSSKGADREIDFATGKIPIFYTLTDMAKWIEGWSITLTRGPQMPLGH